MSPLLKTLLTLSWLLLPLLSPAQTLSASKLSAHLINSYTVGSSNIVAGKPRVLKLLAADTYWPAGMLTAMRDFKAKAPNGIVVVRVYSPQMYDLSSNATVAAGHYWTNSLKSSLDSISAADRALIDYLEGPNEGQTPTLGYPWDQRMQAAQWLNQFWTNLTPRIAAAGYKPLIGSIAVGNPGGNPSDWQPLFTEFVPALRQAKAAGGGWSYHSYTLDYSTDFNVEINTSLRYRQFHNFFAAQFPDLADIPLILTEGGVDQVGDRLTSGWQARGSAANYQRWLNWFDHQMQQDSYLLGCTLFQNGDPWWASFDLEQVMPGAASGVIPIADWFRNYLKVPTNSPPVPNGLAATTGTASVTLTWTNTPLHPTTFTVKRSKTNGGPYTIVAENIVNGINETTFTDSTVTNGGTFFYVISALNAFGESTNSAQVTAAIAPLPDVNITSLSTSVSPAVPIYAGNGVVFRAIVKNQGAAATPTGSNKGIGIGFHLGAFFCYRGADETFSLAANASQLFSANGPGGAFTWPATLGAHSLSASVDDINRFPEVDENNNTSVTNLDVGIRINSGGAATTVSFLGDTNFSGGTASSTNSPINLSLVTHASAPASVYQSERAGNFNYTLTNLTPAKVYALRLFFAELIHTNIGQRVFNVTINGPQVLTNLDIFSETGGRNKALGKRFHVAADSNGQINLQFASVVGEAKLSGLDLITTNFLANALPAFLPISNLVVNANNLLSFTAKAVDADQPFQTLVYSFAPVAGPPAGASIDPTTGVFTWSPSASQAGTNSISISVTDGSLFASTSFKVIVVAPPRFSQITNAPDGTLTLNFSAFAGKNYRIEFKNNLDDATWTQLGSNIVASSNSISVSDSTIGNAQRFYRVVQLD